MSLQDFSTKRPYDCGVQMARYLEKMEHSMSIIDSMYDEQPSLHDGMTVKELGSLMGMTYDPDKERIASANGGVKTDGGKLRLDLIEPEFERAMAHVLTYGAKKYGDFNWRGLDRERIIASAMRHFNNYRMGKQIDDDEPHGYNLAATAVNLMFLFWLDLYGEDVNE